MSDLKVKRLSVKKAPETAVFEIEPVEKHHAEKELADKRPKNRTRGDDFPVEGFALAVDGKFKSNYPTSEAAFKVGLELKQKYPVIQVAIYDAVEKTRTIVELPVEKEARPQV
jgi:hypothetical protein